VGNAWRRAADPLGSSFDQWDDRDRATSCANQPILLIHNPNRPDMRGPAHVDRFGRRAHNAIPYRANVVGVDLQSDSREFRVVYVRKGTERGSRFGKRNRCSAVQQAKWLPSPYVNGHCGDDARGAKLFHLDPKRVRKPARRKRMQPGETVDLLCHGESYNIQASQWYVADMPFSVRKMELQMRPLAGLWGMLNNGFVRKVICSKEY
jgi:hypothetical protein